ncbi:hypothetical protein scyTo_0024200, partial [Scyliorhinus torazame]|nr:hypothetical protein [Scyliorhinus torazame]
MDTHLEILFASTVPLSGPEWSNIDVSVNLTGGQTLFIFVKIEVFFSIISSHCAGNSESLSSYIHSGRLIKDCPWICQRIY